MLVLHRQVMEKATGRPYRHDGFFLYSSEKSEAEFFYTTKHESTCLILPEDNVGKTLVWIKIYNYERDEIVIVGIKGNPDTQTTETAIMGSWHGLDTPVNIAKFRGKTLLEAMA